MGNVSVQLEELGRIAPCISAHLTVLGTASAMRQMDRVDAMKDFQGLTATQRSVPVIVQRRAPVMSALGSAHASSPMLVRTAAHWPALCQLKTSKYAQTMVSAMLALASVHVLEDLRVSSVTKGFVQGDLEKMGSSVALVMELVIPRLVSAHA